MIVCLSKQTRFVYSIIMSIKNQWLKTKLLNHLRGKLCCGIFQGDKEFYELPKYHETLFSVRCLCYTSEMLSVRVIGGSGRYAFHVAQMYNAVHSPLYSTLLYNTPHRSLLQYDVV